MNMEKSEIETIPERLRTEREDVLNLEFKKESLSRNMEQLKLQTKAAVASEKTDGKNTYPNETARDAETLNRLADNTAYQKYIAELDVAKLDIEKKKIEIMFLCDRLKVADIISRLGE